VALGTRIEEAEQHQAMRLMKCIIANAAVAYGVLDAMYVQLKMPGSFPHGRKMSREVDDLTRYELVGYITALAAILLRCASRKPDEADSIVTYLETLVFLPEWQAARPVYRRYVDHCQQANPDEVAVMSRHKMLLIPFRQTVIDIWSVSPEVLWEDDALRRYREAFTALHKRLENSILNEIAANQNSQYGHLRPSLPNIDDGQNT
jgi:hypothetical protein